MPPGCDYSRQRERLRSRANSSLTLSTWPLSPPRWRPLSPPSMDGAARRPDGFSSRSDSELAPTPLPLLSVSCRSEVRWSEPLLLEPLLLEPLLSEPLRSMPFPFEPRRSDPLSALPFRPEPVRPAAVPPWVPVLEPLVPCLSAPFVAAPLVAAPFVAAPLVVEPFDDDPLAPVL